MHDGVDLFTSNSGGDGMNQEGSKFSYTLVTHDSGQAEDGSVSLNVVNLQGVLSLGGPVSGLGSLVIASESRPLPIGVNKDRSGQGRRMRGMRSIDLGRKP